MPENGNKNVFTDVKEENVDKKEAESGKAMGVISYIGILSLIPYFGEKNNKFVVFHAKQGLNLFIIEFIYNIISLVLTSTIKTKQIILGSAYSVTPAWLNMILSLCSLFFFILSIIGIVYAFQGKAKELPIVNKIKIIK